jgi:HTH-type transcriptional regulator / antitoxin HigA
VISPPGATIHDLLEESNLSNAWLATQLQLSFKEVRALLIGELPIDSALADKLEAAFKTPAAFWLAREASYRNQP